MSGAAVVGNRVRRGFYLDSVALMRLSTSLEARAGVENASLMIGTPSNLALLDEAGLLAGEGRAAGPNDLVLAVRAAGEEALAAALDAAEASLDGAGGGAAGGPGRRRGRTPERFPGMEAACDALPGANLAIVSVPGPFAAREARRALARGLHVLVFSDNVPVEDEAALKREARAGRRLVMGPDCGTAIIAGTPLAFANRVRRGAVGVVSASGTGLQEISVLVHRGGGGLSHGIGVGGRDLTDEIGGLGTFAALDALEADHATRHIVILSKPPGPRTEAALLARIAECAKPITLCLLGRDDMQLPPNAALALTLRDAARLSLDGSGESGRNRAPGGVPRARGDGVPARRRDRCSTGSPDERRPRAREGRQAGQRPEGRGLRRRGEWAGASTRCGRCSDAGLVLRFSAYRPDRRALLGWNALRRRPSNPAPCRTRSCFQRADSGRRPAHRGRAGRRRRGACSSRPGRTGRPRIVRRGRATRSRDPSCLHRLGADEHTAGRPHPMIEPAMRTGALAAALADPTVAAVVLDVVLGVGSHPDPAAPIVGAVAAAVHASRRARLGTA